MEPGGTQRGRRGQPLLVLVAVLAGWGGVRAALWETPRFIERHRAHPAPRRALPRGRGHDMVPLLGVPAPVSAGVAWPGRVDRVWDAPVVADDPGASDTVPADPQAGPLPPLAMAEEAVNHTAPAPVAHQMLWMAAMANLPLPAELGAARQTPASAPETPELVVEGRYPRRLGGLAPGASRWSGDGWLLVRRGGDSVSAGSAPYGPTYGANQIGAVLRYRLAAQDSHKPTAYVRGYGALNGTGEREVAVGLSARPIPALPLVALGEMRASHFMNGTTHARPAASVVTEIPPIRLTQKIEAETYVQAGYVGGAAHTPFIDGQLRVEQIVRKLGHADVRLGVGAWGGAQQGAGRLDVGPTARVSLLEGHVGMRLAVDWRMRVDGNAAPTSGPALTLSAGF